jgi:hypothetical protein
MGKAWFGPSGNRALALFRLVCSCSTPEFPNAGGTGDQELVAWMCNENLGASGIIWTMCWWVYEAKYGCTSWELHFHVEEQFVGLWPVAVLSWHLCIDPTVPEHVLENARESFPFVMSLRHLLHELLTRFTLKWWYLKKFHSFSQSIY